MESVVPGVPPLLTSLVLAQGHLGRLRDGVMMVE
jgi:hypothetical protein